MTKNGLMFAGVLLLGGCVSTPGTLDTAATFTPTLDRSATPRNVPVGECAGQDCRIDLMITSTKEKCEAKPSSSNELVIIRSLERTAPRPKVRVIWLITTPGYSFQRGDGITFKNGTEEFEDGRILNPYEYQWRDKMGQKGVLYNYTIQVTEDSTKRTCIYDPGLVNDW